MGGHVTCQRIFSEILRGAACNLGCAILNPLNPDHCMGQLTQNASRNAPVEDIVEELSGALRDEQSHGGCDCKALNPESLLPLTPQNSASWALDL